MRSRRPPPTNYYLLGIPSGRRGVRTTLKLMSQLVERYKVNPCVRELAVKITNRLPGKHYTKEAAALQQWVQRNIRYVRDVRGVETLQTPVKTLQLKAGDCDDHSILLAAMLESIHHPTRFVAIGTSPGSFNHVFVETEIKPRWVPLETTQPWPMGKMKVKIRERMVHHNGGLANV